MAIINRKDIAIGGVIYKIIAENKLSSLDRVELTVNQRAKVTRFRAETAFKSFHLVVIQSG